IRVFQTFDFRYVHACTRLSQPFSIDDIENRWALLTFEPEVSREARKRMHEVQFREVVHIQSRTAFSVKEEALLNSLQLGSLPSPTRQMMEDLL
ncbi:hypothetical protein V3C99_018859, partial [Haemonchus contortus]|uniref:MCRS_N domain-containing protein n=1 Tax=Haemonchus contortus TaxID=6289 RepID=A0A7I4Z3N9_HAECO